MFVRRSISARRWVLGTLSLVRCHTATGYLLFWCTLVPTHFIVSVCCPWPCVQTGIPVLGVVENMSGLRQPLPSFKFFSPSGTDITSAVLQAAAAAAAAADADAGSGSSAEPGSRGSGSPGEVMAETAVFHVSGGGAAGMAADMQVPYLGSVPLDSALSRAGEEGRSVFDSAGSANSSSGPALQAIINKLLVATGGQQSVAANGTK